MLNITHQALEKFDNQHDFERMTSDILNRLGYADVTPIAPKGGSDGGKDVTFSNYDHEPALACVSLRKDAKSKILSDLKKRKTNDYREYTFFTNQYLTSDEKIEIAKYCIEHLNAQFVPRDIEALRSLLDTQMQDIREQYLGIENKEIAYYEVIQTEVKIFSLTDRISEAERTLEEYNAKLQSEQRSNPFGMNLPILTPFRATTSEMVSSQTEYIQEVKRFSNTINKRIGFNLIVTASTDDEHVEISVKPKISATLNFGYDTGMPEEPTWNSMAIPYDLGRIANHRDHSEFYAATNDSDGSIKSNLEKINPSHPKLLFDEDVYITLPTLAANFVIEITIYSRKIKRPQVLELEIDISNAQEIQI